MLFYHLICVFIYPTICLYVYFSHLSIFIQVKAAKEALHDRYFSGRRVRASVYDQELYDNNDLSG